MDVRGVGDPDRAIVMCVESRRRDAISMCKMFGDACVYDPDGNLSYWCVGEREWDGEKDI